METRNKLELVQMPAWTYKEIMEYVGVSPATAIKIKARAIKEKNGLVEFGTTYVKTDSVLALYGTSREQEIEILKRLNNGQTLQEENSQN